MATPGPKNTSRHSRSEQTGDGLRNDANDLRGLGVREQIDLLKKVEQPAPSEREIEVTPARDVASPTFARRVIKTVAALLLAIALGWMPVQRLFLVTSAEATVNARVLTLRSPIDGQIVDWRRNSRVGTLVHSGDAILRIENPRADRGRLDELRRNQSALEHQRQTSEERLIQLERERAVQLAQFSAFSASEFHI